MGANAIGGEAFRTQGIGRNRGAGGTNHIFHSEENKKGDQGVLYVLSTEEYCMFELTAIGGDITAVVTNDSKPQDGDYVINTNATAGTITGTDSVSFIVKKGATISCTITKTDYYTVTETYIAGSSLDSDNVHKESVSLNKIVYAKTLRLNGANIVVTGRLTDANGNVISSSISGNNSVTFNVWKGDNTIHWETSRTYYDGKSGDMTITSGGTENLPTLDKHKYYATLGPQDQWDKNISGKTKKEWTFKNATKYVNATWTWNPDEISKASGTRWKLDYNGFGVSNSSGTNISYGPLNSSNNLPSSMNIEFSNYYETHMWSPWGNYGYVYWDRTFTIGDVWVILEN